MTEYLATSTAAQETELTIGLPYLDLSTVSHWDYAELINGDKRALTAVMAFAFRDAAISVKRHEMGHEDALDLPVGAAILNHRTGQIHSGFARDQETNDPKAHAEVVAIESAKAAGMTDFSNSTLGVTLETCPSCLDPIAEVEIPRIVYGTSRQSLAALGLVKSHGEDIHGVLDQGQRDGKYQSVKEVFQFPIYSVQMACLEPFTPMERDLSSGQVKFVPERLQSTRYHDFLNDILEAPREYSPDGAQVRRYREIDIVLSSFVRMLEQFQKHLP